MESSGRQNPGAVRAQLEFPVWHRAFTKAYTAWASAPSDLKTPLLLQGPALAKAESWLLACPDKLNESQKRFIVRSISQRAKGPLEPPKLTAGTKTTQWKWRRSSDRSLWHLYAVIALGLWFFSPDIIRDGFERALNPPEMYRDLKEQRTASGSRTSTATPHPESRPPSIEVSAVPEVAPPGDIDETPPLYMPEVLPASPAVRTTDKASQQLETGNSRTSLLLAIEAAEAALAEQPPDQTTATRAVSLLSRAMATRDELGALAPRSATARTTIFCDEARALIAISADEQLSIWQGSSPRRTATQALATSTLSGAAVDRDCRRILLPNEDFNVEVRPIAGGRATVQLQGHEADILSSSFSPDGTSIVTASQDSTARVWDARTGRQRTLLSGHDWHVVSAQFSPDGRRIVTASSDMTARIWDAASGRELHTLKGHQGIVTSARFSGDGQRILTASWDGYARLWDAATGKLLHAFMQPDGILVAETNHDGQRIASAMADGSMHIWDGNTGALVHSLPGEGSGIRTLEFTPDGRWLTSLSWMGRVDVYDARTGTLFRTLAQPEQRVRSIQLGTASRSLVAVTEDGIRLTWPLIEAPAEAISQAKSIAPACLTTDERTTLGLEGGQPAWCGNHRPRGASLPSAHRDR